MLFLVEESRGDLPGKILAAIQPLLKPQGTVLLVANKFLDYAKEAARRFAKVEILAREKGYQVFRLSQLLP